MADTNIDIKQSKGGRAKGITRGRKRRCSKGEKQGAVGGGGESCGGGSCGGGSMDNKKRESVWSMRRRT